MLVTVTCNLNTMDDCIHEEVVKTHIIICGLVIALFYYSYLFNSSLVMYSLEMQQVNRLVSLEQMLIIVNVI